MTEVHTKRNGIIDVDGVVAGIMAVLGAHEVKQLRKRLLDKKGELAAQGRPGGRLGYGYRQKSYTPKEWTSLREWQERRHKAIIRGEDMRQWKADNPKPPGGKPILDEQGRKSAEIVPEEAEAIRECAKRLLNGWGVTKLAAWLNEQGLRGKHGGRFVPTSVSDFLTAPCVAGLRAHHDEVVGKATWEPILDEATWRSVCAVIGARRRSPNRGRRSYLLTGYRAFCECEKPLQASGSYAPSGAYAYYACDTKVTGGCGETRIDAPTLEAHVAYELFDHLVELRAGDLLSTDRFAERRAEVAKQLEGLDARRTELAQMWNDATLTTEQFQVMNDGVTEKYRALERELAELPIPGTQTDPDDLRAAWPEMELDEQRKFIDDWIERVTVGAEKRKLVTQKTVAEKVGCSQGYVSLVYLGKAKNPEMVARVQAAIDELGYEPSAGKNRRSTTNTDRVNIDWRA